VTMRAAGSRVRTAGSALNAPPTHCFRETWVVRDIGGLAVMPAFRWRPQRSASCPALRSGAEDSRAAERQRPPGRGPRARERRLQARLAQQPTPTVPTVAACAKHLIARQADRAVDVADGTGPASSRTATPGRQSRQARRCFVRQSLWHSRPLPRTPSRGLAAALRGLTQEDLIIIYDQIQTDDEGVVSQPEYTFEKPSSGPNDRGHLRRRRSVRKRGRSW